METEDETQMGDESVDALILESVWLKQKHYEESEAFFQCSLVGVVRDRPECMSIASDIERSNYPNALMGETVWFAQSQFEALETKYHTDLAERPDQPDNKADVKPKVQVEKKKLTVPDNVDYKEKLDKALSQLRVKQMILNNHLMALEELREDRMSHFNMSIVEISNVLSKTFARLNSEVAKFDEHLSESHKCLHKLRVSLTRVKEESEAITAGRYFEGPRRSPDPNAPPHTHKSLTEGLTCLDNELKSWFEAAGKMNICRLDSVPSIVESIKQLKFVENINLMEKKYKKKYPQFQNDFNKLGSTLTKRKHIKFMKKTAAGKTDAQTNDKIAGKKENSKNLKSNVDSDVDNDIAESESLDGSLGDECHEDVTTPEGNVGTGASSNNVTSASNSVASQPKSVDTEKKKAQVPQKKLSRKKSQMAYLKAMAEVGVDFRTSPRSNFKKKIKNPPPNPKQQKAESQGSGTSLQNANQQQAGRNIKYAHYPSGDGGYSLSGQAGFAMDTTKLTQGMQARGPYFSSPFSRYPSAGLNVDPVQQFRGHKQYQQHVQGQLMQTAQQIRQMYSLSDSSQRLQLQEMMTETELLMQMVHHNLTHDQFPHRYALLMMAFNFLQETFNNGDQVNGSKCASQGYQVRNGPSVSPGHTKPPITDLTKPMNHSQRPLMVAPEQASAVTISPVNKLISYPRASCLVKKESTLNPSVPEFDDHRAGISSLVVMDEKNLLVMIDIINSCIKLYDTRRLQPFGTRSYVSSLPLRQPYYMSFFRFDKVVVSRAEKILTVVRVGGDKHLQVAEHLKCRFQYYGLALVQDNLFACACYDENRIDLVKVKWGSADLVTFVRTQCYGPELLAIVPGWQVIAYLERIPGQCMHLSGVNTKGSKLFQVSLGGKDSDVWNLACTGNKIVCCSKQANKVMLYTKAGGLICSLAMPAGSVTMPFAMTFSNFGELYIANDAAWEEDHNHYVTTEVNMFSFHNPPASAVSQQSRKK